MVDQMKINRLIAFTFKDQRLSSFFSAFVVSFVLLLLFLFFIFHYVLFSFFIFFLHLLFQLCFCFFHADSKWDSSISFIVFIKWGPIKCQRLGPEKISDLLAATLNFDLTMPNIVLSNGRNSPVPLAGTYINSIFKFSAS